MGRQRWEGDKEQAGPRGPCDQGGAKVKGKHTEVEAGTKPAGAACPCWAGRGEALVVSWGLQHWAKT